jgi:putative nucleotidyltransferase with HDIG domain
VTTDTGGRLNRTGAVVAGVFVLAALMLTSFSNYLLFHGLAEMFSIAIACAVFLFALNSRGYMRNDYLFFFGISVLFVTILDTFHTLAFKGMGVFPGYDANLPTQLWIAARYLQSAALLAAPLFLHRRVNAPLAVLAFTAVTGILLGTIFVWPVFPVCYIEGIGLTAFKIYSEYIICAILIASMVALHLRRDRPDRETIRPLLVAIGVLVLSELAFTTYVSVFAPANAIGHLLRIVAYVFLYEAVIETGMRRPYDELHTSQASLALALQAAVMGVWHLDVVANTRTFDERCCLLHGLDPATFTGSAEEFYAVVHPHDVLRIQAALSRTVEAGSRYELEYRAILPDGAVRWIANRAALANADARNPQRVAGILWDVTERRQDLERLARSLKSTVEIVSQISETRDPYTAGHQRRVSELAVAIAQEMRMPPEQVEQIRVASLLHDIGKMSVPAEILSKPGMLSSPELQLIRGHSGAGYEVISRAHMEGSTAEIVLQHHERCDGSGYPRGLESDELLPESKVLMVADVVEAMMSHRPYRPALGVNAALAEIERGAGTAYDADVCRACVTVFREQLLELSA